MGIIVKSAREVAVMREVGRIVARVLEVLAGQLEAGDENNRAG